MRNLSKRNLKKNRKTAPAPTGTAGSIQDRSEGSGQDQADSKADGRYGKGCSGRLQPFKLAKISYFEKHEKTAETLAMLEFPLFFIHERAGIRTPDNLIKSQVLYHLSYTPLFSFILSNSL